MSSSIQTPSLQQQQQPQHHQQQQQHSRNVIENVIKNIDSIITATNVKSVLEHNKQIARLLHYNYDEPGIGNFFKLRNALNVKSISKWNRVSSILKTLSQKSESKEYQCRNKIHGRTILVIGGGISGLRVSIELLLLGAKVFCVEKRDEFTRNNVIHLWPNVINDMYTFEAKRFYGQFCVGSIDHVSIRQLQLILLKIAIIYGLRFHTNTTFNEICPRTIKPKEYKCDPGSCDCCCHVHGFGAGAYAHFTLSDSDHANHHKGGGYTSVVDLNQQPFDVIIGCDGRRNTFSRYFPRNNRRGKLALGLTANFTNRRTEEEAHCPEISGISRIYNQKWFKDLQDETDIELENLVYYRDETHYFVMTATKASLLKRGVLRRDFGDSHQLLHLDNIDTNRLIKYTKDAAEWSSKLRRLEFAKNSNNVPDVALFDFTSMYSATNSSCAKKIYLSCCDNSKVIKNHYKYMLILLCGDSLLEPFWPTGSGAGRGFLSALDAAWVVSQWFTNVADEATNIDAMLNVISKREYVYRLLAQTSPENTANKNFTLDPQTRYKNLNILDSKALQEIKQQVRHLIIDDDLDMKTYLASNESRRRARRATVGIDPDDVIKAKNLNLADLDECAQQAQQYYNNNHHHNARNYNRHRNHHPQNHYNHHHNHHHQQQVPSMTTMAETPLSKSLYCDSSNPVQIIEYKPKNYEDNNNNNNNLNDSNILNSNSVNRHVDVQPRNNDDKYSNLTKKNHFARNHFFDTDADFQNSSDSYDRSYNNTNQSSSNILRDRSLSSHHNSSYRSVNSSMAESANNKNNNSSSSSKENTCPIPDFKQMFDFDIGDFNDSSTTESSYSYNKKKSFSSSDSFKNRFNPLIQDPNLSLHDYAKSLNRKPIKKSSDIMEKAQNLEQKFDELNKPYVPRLSKVGKIEENDWNVKMWNSDDIFAPKVEKKNLVYENSKDLLQSRIAQLSNNMEYNRKEIPKSTPIKTNDYVNMLTKEVCQKFNSPTSNSNNNNYSSSSAGELLLSRSFSEVPESLRYDSTDSESRLSKKSEFFKPIGHCKRCDKILLTSDRVTIAGQNFHRNCLTCKICSVMLRHDEVVDSDFTCKICIRNQSRMASNQARNAFMMSSSTTDPPIDSGTKNFNRNNLPLIEAKRNFLINVQQIDLRERAEFEIIVNDKKMNEEEGNTEQEQNSNSEEIPIDDIQEREEEYFDEFNNDDEEEEEEQEDEEVVGEEEVEQEVEQEKEEKNNLKEPVDNKVRIKNNKDEEVYDKEESSELSESDLNYNTSDNYTDDENSDDDDNNDNDNDSYSGEYRKTDSIKDDYGSGLTSLICTTTNTTVDDSDCPKDADDSTTTTTTGCSNAELVELITPDTTTTYSSGTGTTTTTSDALISSGSNSTKNTNCNNSPMKDNEDLKLQALIQQPEQPNPIFNATLINREAFINFDKTLKNNDALMTLPTNERLLENHTKDNNVNLPKITNRIPRSMIAAPSAKIIKNNEDEMVKSFPELSKLNGLSASIVGMGPGSRRSLIEPRTTTLSTSIPVSTSNIITQTPKITNTNSSNNKPVQPINKNIHLPYRYRGQFTEKFYRSRSQPSLYDKLNLIDDKLKTISIKKPAQTSLTSNELPFADSSVAGINNNNNNNNNNGELDSSVPTNTNRYGNRSTIKLSQAPFARIDDV